MSGECVNECLAVISDIWQARLGRPLSPGLSAIFAAVFRVMDDEMGREVLQEQILTCPFVPMPADIRNRFAEHLGCAPGEDAEQAIARHARQRDYQRRHFPQGIRPAPRTIPPDALPGCPPQIEQRVEETIRGRPVLPEPGRDFHTLGSVLGMVARRTVRKSRPALPSDRPDRDDLEGWERWKEEQIARAQALIDGSGGPRPAFDSYDPDEETKEPNGHL